MDIFVYTQTNLGLQQIECLLYCVNISYYYCVNIAGLNENYFLLLIPTLVQVFKIIHSRKFWKV